MSSQEEGEAVFGERTLEVITERRCCRSFCPREVGAGLVEQLLLAVRNVPSSQNTQPWGISVVVGESLAALSAALLSAFEATPVAEVKPDYRNRPSPLPAAEQERLADYGRTYYSHLQIQRDDAEARRGVERRNYTFFGAPVVLILHTTALAVEGTFLDCGIFLGTLLHAVASFGLGACPQFSIAKFPAVVREQLSMADDRSILCAIAIGFPDAAAAVNSFKPKRAPLTESVTWHGLNQPISGIRRPSFLRSVHTVAAL